MEDGDMIDAHLEQVRRLLYRLSARYRHVVFSWAVAAVAKRLH